MKILATVITAAFTTAGWGENLIKNGDFETVLRDGHPDGYSRAPEWGGALSSTSSFTSTTNAYSGKYAGLYSCQNMGGFISYRNLHVKPSTWYRFSAMIAADVDPVMASTAKDNPPPGVFVKLMPQIPSPWPKMEMPILYAGGGETDWTLCERYFKSDAVHTNLWIGIYIMKVDGTAHFDEIKLEETTAQAARAWEKRVAGSDGSDGENLIVNGSFELAVNDDMPDYIYSGIGAPWFNDRWAMKRLGSADAPDGGHYLHGGNYMSMTVRTDTNRTTVVSFYARSDKPRFVISGGFNGTWTKFTLTEKWQRYSFVPKAGSGGRLHIQSDVKDGEFDLDAVMVHYGEELVPFARKADDAFFASYAEFRAKKGEDRNRAFAGKAFKGPLAVPPAKKDGILDFRFDTVFSGEGLITRGRIDEPSRELEITNAAGQVAWKGTVSAEELAKGVPVAKDLPEGEYGLIGVKYGFRVVKPAERWCRVDRFAHMAFTEKGPYLPCSFSMVLTERFQDRIPEIAEAGFNTALVWGYGTNTQTRHTRFDPAVARRLLDKFGKAGISVIAFTPTMSESDYLRMRNDKTIQKVFGWEIRENPFETVNAAKLDFVNALKDHPAVRMWHYYDEIYGPWEHGKYPKKEEQLQITYKAARALDPYRLHWSNSTYANRLYGGAESTDITSATIYTIGYTGGASGSVGAGAGLAQVGEKLGGRPGMAGIWLQFYSGDGEVSSSGREPSAEEMEGMMYGCAIKGVRAFWYFSMRPRSNRLWFRTGELAREMDVLKDVFAFGKPLPFAGTHLDVEGSVWDYAGKLYLVTCNRAYWAAKGKLNLPAPYRNGKAEVLFENRTVDFADWTLADEWKALQRHVYVINGKKK